MTVTQEDIEHGLRELGLGQDSHVLVHSSYKAFGGVEGGQRAVVDALVSTVATVIMPAFTSERTGIWDARAAFAGNAYPLELPDEWNGIPEAFTHETPVNSMMGVISETLRREYAVTRSAHPLVSFIAYGEVAEEVTGPGTEVDGVEPIKRLMDAGGDVLLLGVSHGNSTAVHLAEQLAGRQLFLRYGQTPDGVREGRTGGCGNGFDDLQPQVEQLERRVAVGQATLRSYALQPYVEAARAMIERDPQALLCAASTALGTSCVRCDAHRNRVPA